MHNTEPDPPEATVKYQWYEYPLSFFGSLIFAVHAIIVPMVIGLFVTFGVIVVCGLVIEGTGILPSDLASGIDAWLRYSVGWTFFGGIGIGFIASLFDLLKTWAVVRSLRRVARTEGGRAFVPIHYQMHEVTRVGGAGLTAFFIGIACMVGLVAVITLGMAMFDGMRDEFLNLIVGITFAITGAAVGGALLMIRVVHKRFATHRTEIEGYWPKSARKSVHTAAPAFPSKRDLAAADKRGSRLRSRLSALGGASLGVGVVLLHVVLIARYPGGENSDVVHYDNQVLENAIRVLIVLMAVAFFVGGIAMLIGWMVRIREHREGRERLSALMSDKDPDSVPDPVLLSRHMSHGWVLPEGQFAGFGVGLLTLSGTALGLANQGIVPFTGLADTFVLGVTVGAGLIFISIAIAWYALVYQRDWRNMLNARWPMRPPFVKKSDSIDSLFR